MADVLTRARVTGWDAVGETPLADGSVPKAVPAALQSFEVEGGAEGWLADPDQGRTGAPALKLTSAATPLHHYVAGLVERLFVPREGSEEVVRSVMFAGLDDRHGSAMLAAAAAEVLATCLPGSVCIVDANLAEPSLDRHYGVPSETGLAQFLAGSGSVDDYAKGPTEGRPDSLWLMPAGTPSAEGTGLFSADLLGDRLRELLDAFDHVVIVAPPLTPEPDAALLGAQLDGVVLVADSNVTPRELSQAAAADLRASGARVLGTVLHNGNIPPAGAIRQNGAPGNAVHLFDPESRPDSVDSSPHGVPARGVSDVLAPRPTGSAGPGSPRPTRDVKVESLLYSMSRSGSPLAKRVNSLPPALREPLLAAGPSLTGRLAVVAAAAAVVVLTTILLWPRSQPVVPASPAAIAPPAPQTEVPTQPAVAVPAVRGARGAQAATPGTPAGSQAGATAGRAGARTAPPGTKPRAGVAALPRRGAAPDRPAAPAVRGEGGSGAAALPASAGAATEPDSATTARGAETVARAAIDRLLRQYEQAFDRLDVLAAAAAWRGVNTAELTRAFQSVRSQDLTFENCDITLAPPRGTARCSGMVRYVPRDGGPTPRVRRVNWVIEVAESDDRWTIERVTTTDVG